MKGILWHKFYLPVKMLPEMTIASTNNKFSRFGCRKAYRHNSYSFRGDMCPLLQRVLENVLEGYLIGCEEIASAGNQR